MQFTGWGRFPVHEGTLNEPSDAESLRRLLQEPGAGAGLIPRGAGRSYGDSALADRLLGSRYLDHFFHFDRTSGELECAAGVSLAQILALTVPAGWFLPVVPGTNQVSLGGAIASDIHGKNHHRDGCLSNFINSLQIVLASGETVRASRAENTRLFHASCGGMGLTGMIVRASLRLLPLPGNAIRQRHLIADHLRAVMDLFDQHGDCHYSVAWLDCLARGDKLGRSVLFLGEHMDDANTASRSTPRFPGLGINIPFTTPGFLLNRSSMSAFNRFYYHWYRRKAERQIVGLNNFFFPLDSIHNWNRLYGSRGFLQYQLVLPAESAYSGLSAVLQRVSAAGKGSFLSVLKKMGPQNANLLSFPCAGYTLALDFKITNDVFQLLDSLDDIVLHHGGRLYLAKDARMSEHVFKAGYPDWEQFVAVKQEVDPQGIFASVQSRRLGLST